MIVCINLFSTKFKNKNRDFFMLISIFIKEKQVLHQQFLISLSILYHNHIVKWNRSKQKQKVHTYRISLIVLLIICYDAFFLLQGERDYWSRELTICYFSYIDTRKTRAYINKGNTFENYLCKIKKKITYIHEFFFLS